MMATPSAPVGGAELSAEAIERSLRDLWREMEEAQAEVTQVRMLNLIVYLPEPPTSDVRAMISSVAVQHPGRTISLLHDDGPPRAEATIACRIGGGQRHACGEQITLSGSAGGYPLHSLAVALLQAGLPVTIWWHGPIDFDDHIFRQLAKVADRIILDSRTWHDPPTFLQRLAEIADVMAPVVRFSDLQWVELTPWRRLIAQAFDVRAARAALPRLTEVVIEYGGSGRPTVAALLVVGWLMSRLNWQIDDEPAVHDDTGYILPLRRTAPADGPRLLLALRARPTEEPISAVVLGTDDEPPARVALRLSSNGLHVETRIDMPSAAPLVQVSNLGGRTPAQLLGEELALTNNDAVFSAALRAAVELGQGIDRAR